MILSPLPSFEIQIMGTKVLFKNLEFESQTWMVKCFCYVSFFTYLFHFLHEKNGITKHIEIHTIKFVPYTGCLTLKCATVDGSEVWKDQ